MNYMDEGQGDPLIMIIGLGSDQSNWKLQTAYFKKHYRTVTFDNRGAGKSGKPNGPYTIKMMADDTIGLMDHLGIEKAHVLGVSMGGMIAQELAINYPERVNKLILGCTFARRDGASGFSVEIDEACEVYARSSRDMVSLRRLACVFIDLSFNKGVYRVLLLPIMKAAIRFSTITGFSEQLEAILAHDAADRLGLVRSSTLVVVGSEDRVIKPASSGVIAGLVSDAKYVVVEGGSHGFSGEMSGEFNGIVHDFLRS